MGQGNRPHQLISFLLELPKFPQPAGLRLGSQIRKGLFFRPFSYHNKSSAVIFSSQSALCPFWEGWWWWRQIRNSYCKKNYKHHKKGPSPRGVQYGEELEELGPLYTLGVRAKKIWGQLGAFRGCKLASQI